MYDPHGHVSRGSAPAVRELTALIVTKVSVGPMDNNAYLLRCRATGATLLVDAADDADVLLALVAGAHGTLSVVTTHRHRDHWQALGAVADATGAHTLCGVDDAEAIGYPTARLLHHGDEVVLGEVILQVVHLRGHTPGSVALVYDDPHGHPHLWTGDSLFPGGPGKNTPDTFPQLMDDLEARVFDVLPDETWVYPGHGDDTVLGRERPQLAQWRARGW